MKKLQTVNELRECGADGEIVHDYVLEVENDLITEATACVQQGKYALAIRKYFLAILLPGRTERREELMHHALYSCHFLPDGDRNLDQTECLKDQPFSELKQELNERLEEDNNKEVFSLFAKLDSQSSLLDKDFDQLDRVIGNMNPSKSVNCFVAELRLSREKEAQRLFKEIVDLFRTVAKEVNYAKRQAMINGNIRELVERAIDMGSGGNPAYGQQIRTYVSEAEKLLVRSHTETVIDGVYRGGANLRNQEFAEFKNTVMVNSDESQILESICKMMKSFRAENLYEEVRQISLLWIQEEAKLRYRLVAMKEPAKAELLVKDSIELIQGYRDVLSEEISVEFKDFLDELSAELSPALAVNTEPPAQHSSTERQTTKSRNWLSRILGWLRLR